MDDENVLKMLTILFPCSLKKIRPGKCKEKVKLFSCVFHENNFRMRREFFSDPLIRYIWPNIFVKEDSDFIVTNVRWVRSKHLDGPWKANTFLKNMQQMELDCNVEILPDNDKLLNITEIMSKEEEYHYLISHGKKNKRDQKNVRFQIGALETTMLGEKGLSIFESDK